jgi:hypothetical protein
LLLQAAESTAANVSATARRAVEPARRDAEKVGVMVERIMDLLQR